MRPPSPLFVGSALTVLVALAGSAPAQFPSPQGDRVRMIGHVDAHSSYNDVWGYVDTQGREFALLGTEGGLAIYDCSTPSTPVLAGFVAGATSLWRDVKTNGRYAYVVTEGAGGMQIVDLQDPYNPVLIRTWGTGLWRDAHNVFVDEAAATAYVAGTNRGLVVLDVANPTNPVHVADYTANYVHDLYVANGKAHLAAIYAGRYRILDVSALPSMPSLGSVVTPRGFTHNVWVDATGTIAATTDEATAGDVAFYDVSNPASIQLLSTWSSDGATVHNVLLAGTRAHVSTYTKGYACLDFSDPANPVLVGGYDTSLTKGSGYSGAWGVYPFSPSGLVYVSDIAEGLFVLQVDGDVVDVTHTPLADTEDENGPYLVTADAVPLGSSPVSSGEVVWSTAGGGEQRVPMTPVAGTTWQASIPGQASPTRIAYHLEFTTADGAVQRLPLYDEFAFDVGHRTVLFADDFESAGDNGWTHGADWGYDEWTHGSAQGRADDPSGGHLSDRCWGTDLGIGGSNGFYADSASTWLESPPIDCSNATGVRLRFARWLNVDVGAQDLARVLVGGQEVWRNSDVERTFDDAWQAMDLDVSAAADGRSDVRIRFELTTNSGIAFGGWNVDDVELTGLEPSGSDTLLLTGPASPAAGAAATWTVAQGPAGGAWWLLESGAVAAWTPFGGRSFELAQPVRVLFQGALDAAGAGSATVTVPAGAAGVTAWLEAAARDGQGVWSDSNLLRVVIQ